MTPKADQVLAACVHVEDENGRSVIFCPGEEIPDWAREQITNPAAWTDAANFVAEPHREPMFDAQNMGR